MKPSSQEVEQEQKRDPKATKLKFFLQNINNIIPIQINVLSKIFHC